MPVSGRKRQLFKLKLVLGCWECFFVVPPVWRGVYGGVAFFSPKWLPGMKEKAAGSSNKLHHVATSFWLQKACVAAFPFCGTRADVC